MKLTAQVKLAPNTEQRTALDRTLRAANATCTFASRVAWQARTFRQFSLHRLIYREIRERFHLSAQMAIQVLAKVADAHKAGRRRERTFRPRGSFPTTPHPVVETDRADRVDLDPRRSAGDPLRVRGAAAGTARCSTRGDRPCLPRRDLLPADDLRGVGPPVGEPTDILGVDLGLRNIAVDSDGTLYSAAHILSLRHRHRRLREQLQTKGNPVGNPAPAAPATKGATVPGRREPLHRQAARGQRARHPPGDRPGGSPGHPGAGLGSPRSAGHAAQLGLRSAPGVRQLQGPAGRSPCTICRSALHLATLSSMRAYGPR